jgi:hypothetical protein
VAGAGELRRGRHVKEHMFDVPRFIETLETLGEALDMVL